MVCRQSIGIYGAIQRDIEVHVLIHMLDLAEIRGLDGERKALVYDNYSKLIAATDTIRKVC